MCGAGSAGSGAVLTLTESMIKKYNMDREDAYDAFCILDKDGLITKKRTNLDEIK